MIRVSCAGRSFSRTLYSRALGARRLFPCRALVALQAVCLLALLAPAAIVSAQPPAPYTRWILAEGAANEFFDEDIVIGNPNGDPVTVKITLFPEGGSKVEIPPFTISATSRYTFDVKNNLPPNTGGSVSAVVESTVGDRPIVVERTMTWSYGQRRGGHNSPGVTSAAPTWYLAEGTTGFYDTFILITNPSPDQDAQVEVKYLRQNYGPVTQTLVVPKNGRHSIWVNDGFDLDGNGTKETFLGDPFSTIVSSTNGVDIAVERAMYWNGFQSGHESAAVTAPNTTWLFAEGATGGPPTFVWDTYLLLANPQATPANVTLTFFRDAGGPLTHHIVVAPNTRETLQVGTLDIDQDGKPDMPSANFSTRIESTQPILAERAMYWSSNGITYIEGHNTPGATETALKWAFADGVEGSIDATGINYDSFFLVSNASTSALDLKATFVREDGKGLVRNFTIPAQTRFTLPTSEYPELSHQRFSAFLESTNNVPFVAERAVYWGPGYYAGTASMGTPWTAAITAPPVIDLKPTIQPPVLPNHGLTTGGTEVTITGRNFIEPLSGPGSGTKVLFGSQPAVSVTIVSDTKLVAVAPPVASPGPVSITASNAHINPIWTDTVEPNAYTYDPVEPTLETELTLGFGDSITFGTSSMLCNMEASQFICPSQATGYPQRVRNMLRARYPNQALVEVTNAGSPGECAARAGCTGISGIRRLFDTLPGPHNLVVLLEGVNDLNVGVSIGELTNTLRSMVTAARSQGKRVILSTLTPVKARETSPNDPVDFWKTNPYRVADMNNAIEGLAAELGVPRVNMFAAFGVGNEAMACNASASCRALLSPDGLHPNDAGYQRMANAIFDKIVQEFEAR